MSPWQIFVRRWAKYNEKLSHETQMGQTNLVHWSKHFFPAQITRLPDLAWFRYKKMWQILWHCCHFKLCIVETMLELWGFTAWPKRVHGSPVDRNIATFNLWFQGVTTKTSLTCGWCDLQGPTKKNVDASVWRMSYSQSKHCVNQR